MTKKFSFLAKRLSVVRCFPATLFLLVLDSIKKRYTCNSGETSIRELNDSGEAGLRTLVMLCMKVKADGGTTTPYRCLENGGNALFSILNHIAIV